MAAPPTIPPTYAARGPATENGADSRHEKRDHTDREPDRSPLESIFAGFGFAFFQYGTDIGCFMAAGIPSQETDLIFGKAGL